MRSDHSDACARLDTARREIIGDLGLNIPPLRRRRSIECGAVLAEASRESKDEQRRHAERERHPIPCANRTGRCARIAARDIAHSTTTNPVAAEQEDAGEGRGENHVRHAGRDEDGEGPEHDAAHRNRRAGDHSADDRHDDGEGRRAAIVDRLEADRNREADGEGGG